MSYTNMVLIGNPKSACLQFYTAKTQAALALPFLPCSTLRVKQCFDSGSLFSSPLIFNHYFYFSEKVLNIWDKRKLKWDNDLCWTSAKSLNFVIFHDTPSRCLLFRCLFFGRFRCVTQIRPLGGCSDYMSYWDLQLHGALYQQKVNLCAGIMMLMLRGLGEK